jgi:hypothetical protein
VFRKPRKAALPLLLQVDKARHRSAAQRQGEVERAAAVPGERRLEMDRGTSAKAKIAFM